MDKMQVYKMKADLLAGMLETVGKLRDSDLEQLVSPVEGMTVWSYDDVETLTDSINNLFEELMMLQEEIQSYSTPRGGGR